MKTDIMIIGAGLTGLTTAYLLARKGREVMVVEQMEKAGGQKENQYKQIHTCSHVSLRQGGS